MEREEESGSLERTIWIEQCGAGRRHNEWQGGGELQSFRRKAQTKGADAEQRPLPVIYLYSTHLHLLYRPGSQRHKYVSGGVPVELKISPGTFYSHFK